MPRRQDRGTGPGDDDDAGCAMTHFTGIDPLYVVSGMGVGFLVGLTGVGGGSVMTPILVLLFGIHPAAAVGTDLLYASITKTAGTVVHGASGTVDWRIVGRLAAGSVPAAALTVGALYLTGVESAQAATIISTVLGAALILTAITVIFRQPILAWATRRFGEVEPGRAGLATTLLGAALGVLVTTSSVGAGALGVTFLLFLYPRLPTSRIVGTDIAHAVPLTLIAGLGHWWLGSVDWVILGSLICGSLPGIAAGSLASARVPDWVLRPTLALMLVVAGSKLVF